MKARKPVQFSIAGMIAITTGYALLFSVLRTFSAPPRSFVFGALFLTTVIYGQWALFDAKRPFRASMFVCGGLCSLMTCLAFLLHPPYRAVGLSETLFATAFAFLPGMCLGLAIGSFIDMGSVFCEICLRKRPVISPLLQRQADAKESQTGPNHWYEGRAVRIGILCTLTASTLLSFFA